MRRITLSDVDELHCMTLAPCRFDVFQTENLQVQGSFLVINHLAPAYRIEMAMALNHCYSAVIEAV